MSRIKDLRTGFAYIGKGFHFFGKHRRLWWYAIIPTMINILVLVGLLFLLFHYFGDLTGWIFENGGDEIAHPSFWAKAWHYILFGLIYIVKVILFIILLLILLIVAFIFAMIIAGPFNDALSEKVEQMVSGKEIPFSWRSFVKSVWRSIITESQKALFFLLIPIVLLLLNLIPVVGSAACIILTAIFASFDIGFNFFDLPMARRLWSFSRRMKVGWKYRYQLTGFGVLSLIPFFPYIFAAPLVAGGTLFFIEVKESESE